MAVERGRGFSGQAWVGSELKEPVGRKAVSEAKESVDKKGSSMGSSRLTRGGGLRD